MDETKPQGKRSKLSKAQAQKAAREQGYVAFAPARDDIVSISQAADVLGVSIDTIRRWDKSGILRSTRPDGKNRYFSVSDLERLKFHKPLNISEVAEQLNVSPSTLRRLEKKGIIKPERNEAGERVYDRKSLEGFLQSEYFVRQKEVEEKILEPLKQKPDEETAEDSKVRHDPATHALLGQHHTSISGLQKFQRIVVSTVLVTLSVFVLTVAAITMLFVLFPESTAKTLGYYRRNPEGKQYVFRPGQSLLARQLKPFSQTSLRFLEFVNPKLKNKISPQLAFEDVNDVLSTDANGNVLSLYTLTVKDSSYLDWPDTGLVENFNSDFVHGKQPGYEDGDLAILPIKTDMIADGSITQDKLAPGIETPSSLAWINSSISGCQS